MAAVATMARRSSPDDDLSGVASPHLLHVYPTSPADDHDGADDDYRPSDSLVDRLTAAQRAEMRAHFRAVPAAAFFANAWVYLGREMRFAARHRDYTGIADLLAVAKTRGLTMQFEAASDRVLYEIIADLAAPPEVCCRPPWDREKRGRRSKGGGQHQLYPAHWWDGGKWGGERSRGKESEKVKAASEWRSEWERDQD